MGKDKDKGTPQVPGPPERSRQSPKDRATSLFNMLLHPPLGKGLCRLTDEEKFMVGELEALVHKVHKGG